MFGVAYGSATPAPFYSSLGVSSESSSAATIPDANTSSTSLTWKLPASPFCAANILKHLTTVSPVPNSLFGPTASAYLFCFSEVLYGD